MKILSSYPWGELPSGMSFDPFQAYPTAPDQVGKMYASADGGLFMLCEAATANVPTIGTMCEAYRTDDVVIDASARVFVAAAAGAKELVLGTGSLTAAAHVGDDLLIVYSTGVGQKFKVLGNSTTTILLDRPLVTAVAITTKALLMKPLSYTQIGAASNTPAFMVGAAMATTTTTNKYYVAKCRGLGLAIYSATCTVNAPLKAAAAAGTAGGVQDQTAATIQTIGICLGGSAALGTTSTYIPIYLTCL